MVIEITLNPGLEATMVRQKSGGKDFEEVDQTNPPALPQQAQGSRVQVMTLIAQPGGDPCLVVGNRLFCW